MSISVRKIFTVIFATMLIVTGAHAASEWTKQGKNLSDDRVWELGAMELYRQDLKRAKGTVKFYELCKGGQACKWYRQMCG